MRNFISIIILSILIVFAPLKQVEASVTLDFSQTAAKVNDMVEIINEIAQKIQKATDLITKMKSIGFGKEALLKYLPKMPKFKLAANEEGIIKGTKEITGKKVNAQQALHQQALTNLAEAKIKMSEENIKELEKEEQSKKREQSKKKSSVEKAKAKYDRLVSSDKPAIEIARAKVEYNKELSEYEELNIQIDEISSRKAKEESNKKELEQEKSKIGTADDDTYQAFEEQKKLLEATEEKAQMINEDKDNGDKTWGGANDITGEFALTEENYKTFIKTYFYDQEEINKRINGEKDGYKQAAVVTTVTDRVTRERKFLYLNTIIHMLQVSATIKRELPERTEKAKTYYEEAAQAEGEVQAITTYTKTRLENARALVLYAKLQAAKLQFLAAKEINELGLEKIGKKSYYGPVELSNYKVDDQLIQSTIDDMSKNIVDLHAGLKGGNNE